MKQCGDLGFACRRHNISNNVRDGMNGAVELGCGNILAFMFVGEEKVSPNAASSLGIREIRGVASGVEDHAASGIPNSCARMGSSIIK